MRLALIRRQFSAIGGAELYLQRLLRELAGRGHELHLFTQSWQEPPPGVTLHTVPVSAPRAERPVRFARAVADLLQSQSFDCVFSLERTLRQDVYRAGDGVHACWLQQRRRFSLWWIKPFVGRSAFHRNMLALEAQTLDARHTRHIIVNSEMVKQEIIERFRFPAERLHLIRNGVDVERFQRVDRTRARARWNLAEDEFVLLFAGSGWERKGLLYLFKAMRQLRTEKIRLLVVGKGTPPWFVPPQIQFVGPLAQVEEAYAAADLFVILPIYEPSANVCFEALAAGLPVVTTRLNGACEVVQEKVNGSVVDRPDQIEAVVKAIRLWMSRPRRRVPTLVDLSLERNVAETLAVLELAAREKGA